MLQKGVVNRDARLGVTSGPSHRLRRKSRAPRHDASMLAPAPRTSSIATGRIPPLLVPMQSIATPTPTHTISSSWPGRLPSASAGGNRSSIIATRQIIPSCPGLDASRRRPTTSRPPPWPAMAKAGQPCTQRRTCTCMLCVSSSLLDRPDGLI